MFQLDERYLDRLEDIAQAIQESEELAQYLEEEDETFFQQMKEMYEPKIALLHEEVADKDPLQLIAFEQVLLDPAFEGLFLPKILGYAVLRGELNAQMKYIRPQDHFRDILAAICNSPNFDILKKRIGQSIQMGFAFSSDIWVTNHITNTSNKRIRYFLQSQKLDRYHQVNEKKVGLMRYKKQFVHENYQTAEFPTTTSELAVMYTSLRDFLIYRISRKGDNSSIVPSLKEFIANEALQGTPEHLQVMMLYGGFFPLQAEEQAELTAMFAQVRTSMPEFAETCLDFLRTLHERPDLDLDPAADRRLSLLVDKDIADGLSGYFMLTDEIHSKGYLQEAVHESIRTYYSEHEGLSVENECLRLTIYRYFSKLIENLKEKEYTEFFEISKFFSVYAGIFDNQFFLQSLKDLSMTYLAKLMAHYTDKRGKDYQDIKKFVATTFVDLSFLTDKEVVEMFKTRRARAPKE